MLGYVGNGGRSAVDGALLGRDETGEEPQQRGLAGSVWPDQADEFPFAQRKMVDLEGDMVAENNTDVAKGEHFPQSSWEREPFSTRVPLILRPTRGCE